MGARRPSTHESVAYVLVQDSDDRLLLVKNAGRNWSLPGGKREAGEALGELAVREAREEAGAIVELGSLLFVSEAPYKERFATFHIFRARLLEASESTNHGDIEGVRWCDSEEAGRLLYWYPQGLIAKLCRSDGAPYVNEFVEEAK